MLDSDRARVEDIAFDMGSTSMARKEFYTEIEQIADREAFLE